MAKFYLVESKSFSAFQYFVKSKRTETFT